MAQSDIQNQPMQLAATREPKGMAAFFLGGQPVGSHPSLIHFSTMSLFRLESSPDTFKHLLREKDLLHVAPIVNYLISGSGHVVYMGGDVVRNLYFHGRKSYKTINIIALLCNEEIERYTFVLNNIISSSDGAFSMGGRYWAKRNRCTGCFTDIAIARYLIEPRLVGPEKLLYPFRPTTIELELTTEYKFSRFFSELRGNAPDSPST
jgi:hypothetical protein